MTDQTLLIEIKNNNRKVISDIYKTHRNPFLFFMINKYRIDMEAAKEVYQEAFLIFHDNVIHEKLVNLSSSIKTYLIQVGRNIVNNEFKRKNRFSDLSNTNVGEESDDYDKLYDQEMKLESKRKMMIEAFKDIGNKCIEILTLFYFQNMRYEEMMLVLNYSNIDSLKTQKYKCFKKLESVVQSKMKELVKD